jgi:hypothetical protein
LPLSPVLSFLPSLSHPFFHSSLSFSLSRPIIPSLFLAVPFLPSLYLSLFPPLLSCPFSSSIMTLYIPPHPDGVFHQCFRLSFC